MTPEGRVYFIDHKTGRTQWEPPTAAAQAPSAPNTSAGLGTAQYGATATARPTTAVSGGGGLPPGWEATVDPSSGKTYYLDHNTRQTHWELPAANPRAAAATSGAGGQQDYSAQWSAYYAAQRAQQMQQVQVQQQRQHAAEQQHYAPRGTGKRGAPAAPSKDPPPEGYVCRLCQVAGHWIQDCPGAVSSLDKAVIVGVPPTVVRACQRASERLPSTPPPSPTGGCPAAAASFSCLPRVCACACVLSAQCSGALQSTPNRQKDGELYCPENHPIDPKAVVRYGVTPSAVCVSRCGRAQLASYRSVSAWLCADGGTSGTCHANGGRLDRRALRRLPVEAHLAHLHRAAPPLRSVCALLPVHAG
jgi:hypothetical protein